MNPSENSVAFGAPGIEPRWTSSAKEGVGTAYHTSCRLWFTLSHGIVNEIYYPHVDQPNTRDFQFLITDGETFCHEEKRDLDHQIEYPERDCVFYRLTNSDRQGRYRLIKHVLTDPHRSVLLVHTRLEILTSRCAGNCASMRCWLRTSPVTAPAIRAVAPKSAQPHSSTPSAKASIWSWRCSAGFLPPLGRLCRRQRRLAGLDGQFQDGLGVSHGRERQYRADRRNRSRDSGEFTIAIACGGSYQSTVAKLLQSLAEPFEVHRAALCPPMAARRRESPNSTSATTPRDGGGTVSA